MATCSEYSYDSMITVDRLDLPGPSPIIAQPESMGLLDVRRDSCRASSAPEIRHIPDLDALPGNLRILHRHDVINLNSEWVADTFGAGTYRYLHYLAYGKDGIKFLEGDIENAYPSCCGCCLGCNPLEIKIHIRNRGGVNLFSICLTGKLKKSPIDTADIISRDGNVIAKVRWKSSCFEVTDIFNNVILVLKVKKCYICTMNMVHKVICPETKKVLGTIESMYPLTAPAAFSGGAMLTTTIPEEMDTRQRVAWISLMFLIKLSHRGREYPKISRIY